MMIPIILFLFLSNVLLEDRRYLAFLADCNEGDYSFQICNHNLLLADTIHRGTGRSPILPAACATIIDEAHKLPDTARQMFGTILEARDIQALIRSLRREKFLLAAETLSELSAPLLRMMSQPFEDGILDKATFHTVQAKIHSKTEG